jgi:hypothetical protein
VRRDSQAIASAPTGRSLIQSLAEVATTPEMTAVGAAMRAITEGSQSRDAFLACAAAQLRAARASRPRPLVRAQSPVFQARLRRNTRRSERGGSAGVGHGAVHSKPAPRQCHTEPESPGSQSQVVPTPEQCKHGVLTPAEQ